MKALAKDCDAMNFLKRKFPKLSSAKVTEGVFIGPQLRELLFDQHFDDTLIPVQKVAWLSLRNIYNGFLGRHKAANFEFLIKNMMKNYESLGCNMSLKLNFMGSHLNFSPENMCDVSDEHCEQFHQEISEVENRFKGKPSPSLLADYCCWTLVLDSKSSHRRSSVMKHF